MDPFLEDSVEVNAPISKPVRQNAKSSMGKGNVPVINLENVIKRSSSAIFGFMKKREKPQIFSLFILVDHAMLC